MTTAIHLLEILGGVCLYIACALVLARAVREPSDSGDNPATAHHRDGAYLDYL